MMKEIVVIIHIVVAICLIGLVLLQSSQGGLAQSFSGSELYRSKRGAERIIFIATICVTALFFATSILNLLLR